MGLQIYWWVLLSKDPIVESDLIGRSQRDKRDPRITERSHQLALTFLSKPSNHVQQLSCHILLAYGLCSWNDYPVCTGGEGAYVENIESFG